MADALGQPALLAQVSSEPNSRLIITYNRAAKSAVRFSLNFLLPVMRDVTLSFNRKSSDHIASPSTTFVGVTYKPRLVLTISVKSSQAQGILDTFVILENRT